MAEQHDPGPDSRRVEVDLSWQNVVIAGLAAIALVVLWGGLGHTSSAVTVIVVAVFLALALDPIVNAVSRWIHLGRGLATVVVLSLVLAAAGAFIAIAGPQLLTESADLEHQLPETIKSLDDLPLLGDQIAKLDLTQRLEDVLAALPNTIEHGGSAVGSVVRTASYDLGVVIVAVILLAGALFEGPRLIGDVRRAIPPVRRPTADSIGRTVYAVLARYFAGSILVALMNGVWVASFALIAGVPLSPVLGVWAAITSLIPQLGGLLGFALVFVVSLTAGIVPTLIMSGAFLAFMLFNNHVLNPTVVGHSVSLSAPVTMIAALAGFSVFGIVGALLAVPTLGAAKSVVLSFQGHDVTKTSSGGPGFMSKAKKWFSGIRARFDHKDSTPELSSGA